MSLFENKAALAIIEAITKNTKGTVYYVGGAVRDHFLDRTPKDVDLLVCGVPFSEFEKFVPGRLDFVGAAFGIMKVTLFGETIDVAIPRTEMSFGAGHRDFDVVANPNLPIEHDLARRDFTMNAIAIDAETGSICDPFGGVADINMKCIACVGNADERFKEDPLRMLRAVRFSTVPGFYTDKLTSDSIDRNAELINTCSSERIYEEFSRILMTDNELRHNADFQSVLLAVIPEFRKSFRFEQKNKYHIYTVAEHVFEALDHAIRNKSSLRTRWAVLLHDIAKPTTFTIDENGQGHFYGHEEKGAVIAREILTRLKAPSDMIESVEKMIKEHLRPPHEASDRVLRRFIAEMGELTEDALMLRECDLWAHAEGKERIKEILDYRERIKGISEVQGFNESKLALNGHDIFALFGIKGKGIGELKKNLASKVIDGIVPNEKEALVKYFNEFLKDSFNF
jgi:tRNA nucleotidyltransferase (CCA-adding enzyme)